jgi:hypothetical protein
MSRPLLRKRIYKNSRTTAASYTVFFDAIAAQGRALLRVSLDPSDTSLTPPQALLTHAQDLRAILSLHAAEADEGGGDGVEAGGEAAGNGDDMATIERALDALVDPAVKMCVAAAEEKDVVRQRRATAAVATEVATATWDRPVFVLNCLTYLVDTLSPHACAARKRTELDGLVETRVLELIEDHVRAHHFFSFSPSLSLSRVCCNR